MAKKRSDFADFDNPATIIGFGVEIEGDLDTEGDIQVNGKFKGDISTTGDVILGDHAEVKANIQASNVYIAGTLTGNIRATQKITIYDTGRVNGNVESQGLVIEPGGLLSGKSVMNVQEESRPEAAPTFEVESEEES